MMFHRPLRARGTADRPKSEAVGGPIFSPFSRMRANAGGEEPPAELEMFLRVCCLLERSGEPCTQMRDFNPGDVAFNRCTWWSTSSHGR